MSVFNRSKRPNPSKEEMGVITYQGLLAHGVKPNPFVSPASYVSHSGISTEKGQRHLEKMCQAWTMKEVERGIEEENRHPSLYGPHKARIGSSTPLTALLQELEKGRFPSDVLLSTPAEGSIASRKSFNIYSGEHTSESIAVPLRRSPKAAMNPRISLSPRHTHHVALAAFNAKHRMGDYFSDFGEIKETKGASKLKRNHSSDSLKLNSFISSFPETAERPKRQSESENHNETSPSRQLSLDENWLDIKIKTALDSLMKERAVETSKLTEAVDKANTALEALVDERLLEKQKLEVNRLEKHFINLQRKIESSHDDQIHGGGFSSSPHDGRFGQNTSSKSRSYRKRLALIQKQQEEQLRREIHRLDSQLSDMQSILGSTSSVDDNSEYTQLNLTPPRYYHPDVEHNSTDFEEEYEDSASFSDSSYNDSLAEPRLLFHEDGNILFKGSTIPPPLQDDAQDSSSYSSSKRTNPRKSTNIEHHHYYYAPFEEEEEEEEGGSSEEEEEEKISTPRGISSRKNLSSQSIVMERSSLLRGVPTEEEDFLDNESYALERSYESYPSEMLSNPSSLLSSIKSQINVLEQELAKSPKENRTFSKNSKRTVHKYRNLENAGSRLSQGRESIPKLKARKNKFSPVVAAVRDLVTERRR